MKTTATISQEELEQKAVDSMIAYEKSLISGQGNEGCSHPRAASLRQQGRTPGNRPERVDYKNHLRPRQQPTERPRPGSFHLHG